MSESLTCPEITEDALEAVLLFACDPSRWLPGSAAALLESIFDPGEKADEPTPTLGDCDGEVLALLASYTLPTEVDVKLLPTPNSLMSPVILLAVGPLSPFSPGEAAPTCLPPVLPPRLLDMLLIGTPGDNTEWYCDGGRPGVEELLDLAICDEVAALDPRLPNIDEPVIIALSICALIFHCVKCREGSNHERWAPTMHTLMHKPDQGRKGFKF